MGILSSDKILFACVLPLWFLPLSQPTLAHPGDIREYAWDSDDGDEGYVPPDIIAPENEFWWNKRYKRQDDDNDDLNPENFKYLPQMNEEYPTKDLNLEGAIVKRDYTAAQLLNMLRQLAKTRKHRQIRIAGKSLRFGISRK